MTHQSPDRAAAGTRPTPNPTQDTGSGEEAARGIEKPSDGGSAKRPGSEPLKERENEHLSGYGGKGGQPKTSSDQR